MKKKNADRAAEIKTVLTDEQKKKLDEHQKDVQDRQQENRRQRNN